jgi:nucleoside-diphosphate-sugar epimerase
MYVENLTDAIIYILKKNYFKGKTYNINDGCIITNEELVSIIANYLDKKVTLFYFPPSILKYIFKFFGSIEIFNKVMEEFIVSNKKFVLDTGWKPKYHYTYGIKKTCLWYKRKFTI